MELVLCFFFLQVFEDGYKGFVDFMIYYIMWLIFYVEDDCNDVVGIFCQLNYICLIIVVIVNFVLVQRVIRLVCKFFFLSLLRRVFNSMVLVVFSGCFRVMVFLLMLRFFLLRFRLCLNFRVIVVNVLLYFYRLILLVFSLLDFSVCWFVVMGLVSMRVGLIEIVVQVRICVFGFSFRVFFFLVFFSNISVELLVSV